MMSNLWVHEIYIICTSVCGLSGVSRRSGGREGRREGRKRKRRRRKKRRTMIKDGEVEHEHISLHLTMQLKLFLQYIYIANKNIKIKKFKCDVGRGGFRGGGLGAEAPPLLGYHLKNDVKSGRST